MKALFLISDNLETVTVLEKGTLKQVRKELEYRLTNISQKENANELQPTMNYKDRFHFYVKNENGSEDKRHMVISDFYKSPKKSLLMKYKVLDIVRPSIF